MKIKTMVQWGIVAGIGSVVVIGLYQQSVLTTLSSYAAYPLLKLNHLVGEPFKRSRAGAPTTPDATVLERENKLLHLQNARLRAALSYADKIKELHQFNERYEGKGQIVQVIARTMTPENHYFLIDTGADRGITKDMVVLYDNNLVGKITEVYPKYSKACLVTDRTCKVAAYCSRTGAQGIYEGLNDQGRAALQFVSHLSTVEEGDLVVSSGEGLVFPAGFALGKVATCTEDGLYKKVTVVPSCDVKVIDYCLVMAKT
jgi:rod shape-determining protein MreC